MTINLLELFKKGIIKKGAHLVNVPIKKANGQNYEGQTYMIPLEYLYYNNNNGRIGVSLSEYESIQGELEPGHSEDYNSIIQNMIINGDGDKTKKEMDILKRDMYLKGQQEVGYVLSDGRVIDGNRRFTAKRLLEQDDSIKEPQFYEAVILEDLSIENHLDQKLIKSLELQIQFGKLDKVDYDPIDRAIDAYKTIIVKKIMNAKDYSEYAGISLAIVNKRVLEAELIVKFLEFVNSHLDNYSLAKQLDLDGPLQDIVPQYKKIKGTERCDQILNSLFVKILQIRVSQEDFKGEFRYITQKVIGSNSEKAFINETEDLIDNILDSLDNEKTHDNKDLFSKLNNTKNIETLNEFKNISKQHVEVFKNTEDKIQPIINLNKAIGIIELIKVESVNKLSENERYDFNSKLKKLEKVIGELFIKE